MKLPAFLIDLLAAPPPAGQGVHPWLFKVARQLHGHLPAVKIAALLEERVSRCGRPVGRREIEEAVRDSMTCAWRPDGRSPKARTTPKWPARNAQAITAICADGLGLADLWEASPRRLEDNEPHTESIVDELSPPDALLCCGRTTREFYTRRREDWRGQLSSLAFIVPSPMSALTGVTKTGRTSARTNANTGPRRFLVIEFDQGTDDDQAALLLHLATYAPLVCALHSGRRSLHGWFYVDGQPEEKVRQFFAYARSLGADRAMWTPSQLVRLPDGKRDNGRRQTVFFLSLNPLKTSHATTT